VGNGHATTAGRRRAAGVLRPARVANREALLGAGATIDARNAEGQTPLHLVVERENVAGVELLLARGADRTLLDNNGESAFDVASRLADAMETTSDELTAIIQLLRPPA